MDDLILVGLGREPVHIGRHRRVALFQKPPVAVVFVELPRCVNDHAAPPDAVAVVEHAIDQRHHRTEIAVRSLVVAHVLPPIPIECRRVEIIDGGIDHGHHILRPPGFLARRVHRVIVVVVPLRPQQRRVLLVQKLARTLEPACPSQINLRRATRQRVASRRLPQALDRHHPVNRMKQELRLEHLLAAALENTLGTHPVIGRPIIHDHLVAGLAGDFQPQPARAHAIEGELVAFDLYRLRRLQHPDRWDGSRGQFPARRTDPHSGMPVCGIKPRPVPARLRQAMINLLALPQVVERDLAGLPLPRFIGYHRLPRAIGKLDIHLQQQPRRPAVAVPLAITQAGGRRKPVAEYRAEGVDARLQTAGHVMDDIRDALVVVGELRRQHRVSHLLPFDGQLRPAQAAHADDRPLDRLGDIDFLAQENRRVRIRGQLGWRRELPQPVGQMGLAPAKPFHAVACRYRHMPRDICSA